MRAWERVGGILEQDNEHEFLLSSFEPLFFLVFWSEEGVKFDLKMKRRTKVRVTPIKRSLTLRGY